MTAPDHLLRKYLRGGCFALAHEAHRLSGLPVMALRDAAGDPHHAFVADGDTAWDIRGRIPLAAVAQGCAIPDPQISPLPLEELRALAGDDPYALDAAARAVRDWLVPDGFPALPGPVPDLTGGAEAPGPCPDLAEQYTRGECHLFAVAALDALAGAAEPLGFRVITDPEEPFWVSDTDPDDQVDAVVHVYAVLRGPDGDVAVDVFGQRPLDEAVSECAARFGVAHPSWEDYPDLEALRDLIEEEADPEKAERCPLWPISRDGIEEARRHIMVLFGSGVRWTTGPDPDEGAGPAMPMA
jgi:hypothetical protein